MSESLKVLQVFIASPSDLVDERRAIKEIADSLNAAFGREVGIQVQLLGWEDRLPGYGRPQAQINEDVDKADLFIGFLWRRWGSDPGDPQYTSGFEEEFTRATTRREKVGIPEISLFFKAVDKQSMSDPGDQLKRVLEFRETVERSKKVLFRNFTDIPDWKEQTRELLQCHLLKLLSSTRISRGQEQPQAPPTTSTTDANKPASGQKGDGVSSAANQQIIRAWSEGLEAVKKGELSGFGKPKFLDKLIIARLGLAAGSLTNRDIEPDMPGAHLLNLLYKNRKHIELTRLESILVLRANLARTGDNQPGWFWLRKTSLKLKKALVHLACNDEHATVRKVAIDYVKELGLKLRSQSQKSRQPIEVLCSHSDDQTRIAALSYLSERGTERDLPLVEKLRTDSDNDVRSQAELARNSILLRSNAGIFFETFILTTPWVSDDSLQIIKQHINKIGPELLRKALNHPDPKVQIFAAKELVARSLITIEEIKALKDDDGACEVLRAYYLISIAAGKRFPAKEIRNGLKPPTYGIGLSHFSQVDIDSVLVELFKLYTYEELDALAKAESTNAPIAYRVLAEKHFNKFAETVREDLKNDFAALRSKLKADENPASPWHSLGGLLSQMEMSGKWVPNIEAFLAAALTGLAIHGNGTDRELIDPFLDHKSDDVRLAAISCLKRLGSAQDTELALQIAEEAGGEISIEAAKVALLLSPGEAGGAGKLLKCKNPDLFKLAVVSQLSNDTRKVWPQIKNRLYDGDAEIRKMVCAYALKKFSIRRVEKLLTDYLLADQYYYSVVFFLDRALYAKLPLRKLFVREVVRALE